ncbi:VOC family protein [uncultured Merdimonas sp.]|uniref:VOC family protein n=1 Tax=uncultured Merdimonas sp. TaxID=2023269 RepID=UPI0032099380
MKLKNVLIVVSDLERSRKFYQDLFGLDTILKQDGNVILTEGLVLQEKQVWEEAIGRESRIGDAGMLLYFEEKDMETFQKKLEKYQKEFPGRIRYLGSAIDFNSKKDPCQPAGTEQPAGADRRAALSGKVLRFYDPDGHLIEVRER